ncbi:hypothetical protein BGAL_0195g00040 [Botrytis galanthina]|uniref:C2H2-type domain-containing protein n=1 Tax=Botrytis galanthina TaxID=278940 RepID=A0A4S8QVU9_9HELO|nr:hypothetical protein BGAL_0195g00040 [Botrytis galanthina]
MMGDNSTIKQEQSPNMSETTSPIGAESNGGMNGEENAIASTASATTTAPKSPGGFPSKTDKPKPHGCNTCGRHFARLEHLKRHERSHTKEKPFECHECKRCFARSDLLLRHQQKLHTNITPPARPRNRRSSTMSNVSGVGKPNLNRVRKHSIVNPVGPRPRANTITNPESAYMQMALGQDESYAVRNQNHTIHPSNHGHGHGHSRHASLANLPMHNSDYSGMHGMSPMSGMSSVMNNRNMSHGLPRIETHHPMVLNGLRTAPVAGGFQNHDFTFSPGFSFPNGNSPSPTIDPSALFNHSPEPMITSDSMIAPDSMVLDSNDISLFTFPDYSGNSGMDDSYGYGLINPFTQHMTFDENAIIDGSSPSAISTASQSGISDGIMLDGSNNIAVSSPSMWHQPVTGPPLMTPNFLDHGNQNFGNFSNGNPMSPHSVPQNHANFSTGNGISPHILAQNHDHFANGNPISPHSLPLNNLPYFATPPPLSSLDHSVMPGMNNTQGFQPPMTPAPETLNSTTGSIHGSLPLSTVTDSTRSALANALAHNTSFGGRKFSVPSASSPSPHSPRPPIRANSVSEGIRFHLPSTSDLKKYIGAYIQYFHPHLPFLHIPTLNFDFSAPINDGRGAATSVEGPGCLALSMAAIGALYAGDHQQSKMLFESAKKMLQLYIEARRKADVRRADHRSRAPDNSTHTPVFLAQAMLLNIIYGFNSGDKVAGESALIHCATLVSLANAVIKPPSSSQSGSSQQDGQMINGDDAMNAFIKTENLDDEQEWHQWKTAEERKRTLYAIFILSSMLVSAINHVPFLTNSEIESDLPCNEEFWSAESASSFNALGGSKMANHNQNTFKAALGELLQAGNRQQYQHAQTQHFGNGHNAQDLPQSDLKPSTFGCLILINALHNYIWETRQRHVDRRWGTEETEKMYRHIEPALKAWQLAWQRTREHSVQRPNPFGLGPLSADSVPLLDLAYVRLFVNMSASKEMFWKRNFDDMATELAGGKDTMQHAGHSPNSNTDSTEFSSGSAASSVFVDSPTTSNSPPDVQSSSAFQTSPSNQPEGPTDRERLLRKAAYYATDFLVMSNKFGITFADFASRELPLQAAMCAFDCAQVVAEWISLVQERLGRYIGILGHADVDFSSVPAIIYLEDEDVRLLERIKEVVNITEAKMQHELANNIHNQINAGQTNAVQMNTGQRSPALDNCGFGSKILRLTAYQLDRAAVWQVTRLMARALETQAVHMQTRAERSNKLKDNLL